MQKRVLIFYYSFSGQTRKLITALEEGLEAEGAAVAVHQLRLKQKLSFPLGSVPATLKLMTVTFFRRRRAIEAPEEAALTGEWDLVVLAGPTWSYNPSGPVLRLLDGWGGFFAGKTVLPCISCRGYWRAHYYQLRAMLRGRGARVIEPLVFLHGGREPWRTVGVFLKIAGRMPESGRSWLRKRYPRFGHGREQLHQARLLGERYGRCLHRGEGLEDIGRRIIAGEMVRPAQK